MPLFKIATRETIDREYVIQANDIDQALAHWHTAPTLYTSDVHKGGETVRWSKPAELLDGDEHINQAPLAKVNGN